MSMVIYIKNTSCYNESMELSEWIRKKYIDWLASVGEIRTQREFAEYIGIDKVSMSRYLNNKIKTPDTETVEKFAAKLGPEVYDVLGLARPDPQLQALTAVWHELDDEIKQTILDLALGKEEK